jgi:hypothetical protein
MEPVPPLSIGGHIIAEFEDDAAGQAPSRTPVSSASQGAAVSLEPVPVDSGSVPTSPGEEAAAAQRFWVEVIRRHTEPIPGSETRLRVRDSAEPNRGVIVVEHGQRGVGPAEGAPAVALRHGCEVDVADAVCLTLVDREGPVPLEGEGSSRQGIKESATPIPWTDILTIRFEVVRPLE